MDNGDGAWLLISSALVLFMTPGLALFYGGMVRSRHVLGMLMQSFFAMGLVSVLWVLVGFTLAFGTDVGGGFVGGLDFVGFAGLIDGQLLPGLETLTVPPTLFATFQMMFAIITPALITGAIADRMKFSAWAAFLGLWSILVYSPVAHWVFAPAGWLYSLGALDFAGGTVVHTNAGAAALALALVIGKRRGWPRDGMEPHSLPLTLLGAGILWFGWFGFNGGSALAFTGGTPLAAEAFLNTQVAAGAGLLGWALAERFKVGRATTLGAASGLVAGLVAITPCAGFVTPVPAIVIGFLAGAVCLYASQLKFKLGFDDSLDVVGIHLAGGVFGSLALGLFAQVTTTNSAFGVPGLFFGGGFSLLILQVIAVGATFVYSFVVSYILAKVIDATLGLRVSAEEEEEGLDLTQHAESAYSFDYGYGGEEETHLGSSTVR